MSKPNAPEGDKKPEVRNSTSVLNEKLDATAEPGVEMLSHPSFEELLKKLDEAEEVSNKHWERILSMQAEMENSRRRTERDISNAHKYALEKFVSELLPIVDSLERSIEALHAHKTVEEGVDMTLKLFLSTLEKFGVKQVNPLNEAFNPEFHEAVSTQVDLAAKPGTVLAVLQKGYTLNNRLVRPALVVVAKA